MLEFDRFYDILSELADELPEELCQGLSGGIVLHEELKMSPYDQGDDLVICGEYHNNPLGKQIVIYYGSFQRAYGYMDELQMRMQMRKTLRHELRHHIEGRSGLRDLEVEDKDYLDAYRERKDEQRKQQEEWMKQQAELQQQETQIQADPNEHQDQ